MNCLYIESIIFLSCFSAYNFLLVLCFMNLIVVFSDIQTSFYVLCNQISLSLCTDFHCFCSSHLLLVPTEHPFLLPQVMSLFNLAEKSFYTFSGDNLPTLISTGDRHGIQIVQSQDFIACSHKAPVSKLDQLVSSLRLDMWLLGEELKSQ